MRLRVDPVTATIAIFIVATVVYSQFEAGSGDRGKDNTSIDTFYCLGLCAKIKGEHVKNSHLREIEVKATRIRKDNP